MSKYLVIIKGDVNDGDYAYSVNVASAEEVEHIKELVESIRKIKEVYKKHHFKSNVSWRDNLPYLDEVWESLPECIKYPWEDEEDYKYEDEYEWLEGIEEKDLENFREFMDDYLPYGTSDYDSVHTIVDILVYELASETPTKLI